MRRWILGARLRTLPAGLCPPIGAFLLDLGLNLGSLRPRSILEAALCLLTALFIQLFANFANDYSDGMRGADQGRDLPEGPDRGQRRLLASGLATPEELKAACAVCAGLCAASGAAACAVAGDFWFLLVGLGCILAGWFYVGGRRPYGYMALGELSVLIFFGFVDTMGTGFLIAQSSRLPFDAAPFAVLSISFGLASASVLAVNNFRDRKGDKEHGKITLAVWLGRSYAFFIPIFLFFSALSFSFLLGYYRLPILALPYAACDLALIFFSCRAVAEKNWKVAMKILSSRFLLICAFLALALA
ncbi:MAG: 1,4-dihydroxy-2-naphthoate octaprenyltransferase [Aeriscardovia sp.]|nr:1,4-dihydroxy-2-naphthoate octaprenyltransferase [Aeriscardovia sp.]